MSTVDPAQIELTHRELLGLFHYDGGCEGPLFKLLAHFTIDGRYRPVERAIYVCPACDLCIETSGPPGRCFLRDLYPFSACLPKRKRSTP